MEDDIVIISIINTKDTDGFMVEKEIEQKYWAEIKSTNYHESYKAMAEGISATHVFSVTYEDYMENRIVQNEKEIFPKYVKWQGAKYEIKRQFMRSNMGRVELTCG